VTSLTAIALILLCFWASVLWLARRADSGLPRISRYQPMRDPPSVSVVVPCRDEGPHVEAALRSLLAQDHPALEVVAVDDRSTDDTGAVLDRLATGDPRLAVVHVAGLPEGWLGKNHALDQGGRRARGEWLLFTDGDVIFAPDALRRAQAFARDHGLGHVAATPRFVAPELFERIFVAGFAVLGALAFRVHQLPRAGTPAFAGVGAFNLVRREDWLRIGGHRRLALEVVDDVKLGLILRRSGVAQGVLDGAAAIAVRWQHGFLASMRGLLKNFHAGCEFRPAVALGLSLLVLLAGLGPLAVIAAALLAGAATPLWLGVLAQLISMAILGAVARRLAGGSGVEGLGAPLAAACLAGVILASAAVTHARGGVRWRGTFYPLDRLRRGLVRTSDWPAAAAPGWPDRGGSARLPADREAR
jgi:hypothetical protein